MNARIVKAEESLEDSEVVIEHVGTLSTKTESNYDDPFAQKASAIRSNVSGLSKAFKRKLTNAISKADAPQANMGTGDGANSKQLPDLSITGYSAFAVVEPPYNLCYLASLPGVSSFHYAAVKAKVANIVGLGYTLVETDLTKQNLENIDDPDKLKKTRRKLARAKLDLQNKIEAMNKEDSLFETLVKVWTDYENTGNGYIEIGRTNTGQIAYIGHIPAVGIRVRRLRDGFIQIVSNKAVFFRNFQDDSTPDPIGLDPHPNEIIHIKKYASSSQYYGIPDIIAALSPLAGNELAARFNLDYFENHAVPRHLIILKGGTLSAQAEKALLTLFDTKLKGQNHRSVYVPLPADTDGKKISLEIKPIEANVQDASFATYRRDNRDEILTANRVPLTKVQAASGVAIATALDAAKTFKEQVCAPEQSILQIRINKVIKEFTDVFEISFNQQSLTDSETQSRIDERGIKNQWLVPNEVRANMGMPGLDGGDEPVKQSSSQTASPSRQAARSAAVGEQEANGRNPKGEGRKPTSQS